MPYSFINPNKLGFEEERANMIYELTDTSKVEKLFDGCEFLETAVLSCLQKYAGNIFVTNTKNPHSAIAYLGSFGFFRVRSG